MQKLLLGLIFIFMAGYLYAETIVLKSGKTLEGKIIEQTDEHIKVKMDFLDGVVTYFLDEVDSIDATAIRPSQEEKLPSSSAQPLPSGIIDAKAVLEKIRQAANNATSFQIISTSKMDVPGMMSAVTETFSNIDVEHKKMSAVRKIKEMNIFMEGPLKEALEKKIRQAQLQGLSPEEIEQLRNSLIAKVSETVNSKIEQAKAKDTTAYVIDESMYINIADKWVKMQSPLLKDMWKLYELKRQSPSDNNEDIKKTLAQMQYLEDVFTPFLASNLGDMFNVREGEFSGKSCYVVETQDKKLFDKVRYALGAIDRIAGTTVQSKFNPDNLTVDSILLRQHVSKDNFLPLQSLLEIQVPLGLPDGSTKAMIVSFRKEDSWVFPGLEIILPKEAEAAIPVESEEQAKEILMEAWINR